MPMEMEMEMERFPPSCHAVHRFSSEWVTNPIL